jgi:hypothetical protein
MATGTSKTMTMAQTTNNMITTHQGKMSTDQSSMDKTTMMMTTNHVSTVNDKSTMVSMTTEQSSMTTGQSSATVVSMATEQTKMTTGQSNTTMIPMTTEHSNMTMVPVSQQTMTMPPDVTTKGMMTSHKTNPTPKHTTQSPPTTTKKAKFQGGVFVGGIFLGIGLIVIIAGLIYFLRFRNRSYSKVN